jgi:hypothetical protein
LGWNLAIFNALVLWTEVLRGAFVKAAAVAARVAKMASFILRNIPIHTSNKRKSQIPFDSS